MSAWTVYWLFQLDDINVAITILAILAVIGAGISGLIFLFNCDGYSNSGKAKSGALRMFWPMLFTAIPMYLLSVIIPSTKTMAAIIVLPRIASSENLDMVAKDSGEIYKLAMAKLRDVLGETSQNSAREA